MQDYGLICASTVSTQPQKSTLLFYVATLSSMLDCKVAPKQGAAIREPGPVFNQGQRAVGGQQVEDGLGAVLYRSYVSICIEHSPTIYKGDKGILPRERDTP